METILNNILTLERVDLLNQQADDARKTNVALAFELSKEAIEAAESLGYQKGLAKAYLNSGICCRLTSNFENATENYNKALNIYREINDKKGESRTLNALANVHLFMSSFNDAIHYFDECIFVLESIGDSDFEATVLSNRGLACQQNGDYDSALRNYLQSLSLHISAKKTIPYYLYNNIGIVYLEIGNYFTALKYFFSALKIEENNKMLIEESYAIANIGRTYLYMEDFSNAITYLSEALITMKNFGDRQGESQVYSNLGKAFMKMKRYPEGIKYMNRALKYYKEIGDKSSVSHTLCELGEIYFELNDFIAAKKYFNESLSSSKVISDEINEARNYMGIAKLYGKFHDIDTAVNFLDKAEKLASKRNSLKELSRIYKLAHETYMAVGNTKDAKPYLDKHHKCLNEMISLEETNCIKTFTTFNNFEVELNAEGMLESYKSSVKIITKVA